MESFEAEAKQRWGQNPEYEESESRTSKYSHSDFSAAKLDQEAVTEKFVIAYGNSVALTSPEVQGIVISHREAISRWFYECSEEMQRNLALLYITDDRFKAYYDGRARGLARYVHDAIKAQEG
jgi:hypothetical protein